jgi:peptidoglycan hydrolase CwlO-like protein
MKKIKIIIINISIFLFFCTIGTMCPENNEEFLKQLADLKEEVRVLQQQYYDLNDIKVKLQKEIATKDDKIKDILHQIYEVKKRCP